MMGKEENVWEDKMPGGAGAEAAPYLILSCTSHLSSCCTCSPSLSLPGPSLYTLHSWRRRWQA